MGQLLPEQATHLHLRLRLAVAIWVKFSSSILSLNKKYYSRMHQNRIRVDCLTTIAIGGNTIFQGGPGPCPLIYLDQM